MFGLQAALLLALTSCATVLAAPVDTSEPPVCIVGAGPAGLGAAQTLQARGYETVIFEKQDAVGGKSQNYYDSKGNFYPLGALLFCNETYHETLKIINKVNVTSRLFSGGKPGLADPGVGAGGAFLYEYTTGHLEKLGDGGGSNGNSTEEDELDKDLKRYEAWYKKDFEPYVTSGYKNGVSIDYAQPTVSWLLIHNYWRFLPLFGAGMIPYGYGSPFETPALYMLNYMTPEILRFFANKGPGYVINFHEVLKQHADSNIKGAIHLSTTVNRIDRSGAIPKISYTTGLTKRVQECSKVILAFPPTVRALKAAKLDLERNERQQFKDVGTVRYWAGAVTLTETPNERAFVNFLRRAPFNNFYKFLPEGDGQPVGVIKLHKDSDVSTIWSWARWGSQVTEDEAHVLLKSTLTNLNKNEADSLTDKPGKEVTDADIHAFKDYEYFPHVGTTSLIGGFYKRFNKLQGQRNTYYASGLNGMETVEMALRAGIDVAESYFPKKG